jgi:hypothetical protein
MRRIYIETKQNRYFRGINERDTKSWPGWKRIDAHINQVRGYTPENKIDSVLDDILRSDVTLTAMHSKFVKEAL